MSERLSTLSAYVEDVMQSWQVPGVALAIIQGDEVLHTQGYGFADVKKETPITADTNFAIASVTKTFTAMGVALLVDEGVVEWDKPVRTYLPEFKLSDDYIGERLTLRDMLSHRSGLPRHDLAWYNTDFTREELVHNLRYLKFSKGFREAWQYQNLMYVTVGYLCGKLTGQTWEAFIQSRILDPLDLKRTCFSAEQMEALGDYALPYKIERHPDQPDQDDELVEMPFYENSVMGPAGSLHSNLNDLIIWLKVHLNDGKHGDEQFISPGNLTPMHTPQMVMPASGPAVQLLQTTIFNYGMGWFIRPYRGYTIVEHGGNIDGFSLNLAMIPQAQLGVVILTNIEARPLRDILTYEAIDRALDSPDGEWNAKHHRMWDAMFDAQDQEVESAGEDRVPGTTPSHPLEDYGGDYAADGYADFRVKVEDGELSGWLGGEWWTLHHYHYDVFRLNLERFEVYLPIRFHTDTSGQIASLSMPIEPEVDDIVFTKKPPKIDTETFHKLAGLYDTSFEGLQIDVRYISNKDELVAQPTGLNPMILIPYRVSTHMVEFIIKGSSNRMAFKLADDGQVEELLMKEVGQVITATPVAS